MAIEKVVKRIDLPYKEITGFSGLKRVLIRRHYWFPREGTLARAVHLNPLDISGEGQVQSWPLLTTSETRWGRYLTIFYFCNNSKSIDIILNLFELIYLYSLHKGLSHFAKIVVDLATLPIHATWQLYGEWPVNSLTN